MWQTEAALSGFRSKAEVNEGGFEAKSGLGCFTLEAEVNDGVWESEAALGGFFLVPTPNGAAPPAELGGSVVAVLPLELGLGSDGRCKSRPNSEVDLQSEAEAPVSASRCPDEAVRRLSRADTLSMESVRLSYDAHHSSWNVPSDAFANGRLGGGGLRVRQTGIAGRVESFRLI
jgi:hypothetical protein